MENERITINSLVYNPIEEYGASQKAPFQTMTSDPTEYAQLSNIVKSHFPKMTDEEVRDFLWKLQKEGCGYVAMINTLFHEFIDDRSGFQNAFGFDMYASDGTLNFNQVLVDLYCSMDNHNGIDLLFFTIDYYADKEDMTYGDKDKDGKFEWTEKPFGNNEVQMKYRWETYCKRHGIDVTVKINRVVTPKNFAKHAKNGSVCILCSKFTVYDENKKPTSIKGGHFMIITDVTPDKKYVVSSWGKRYTLDPKDIKGFLYYQVIRYKKEGRHLH
ncbi:MAG: hypothetical protein IJP29_06730 [Lachnospiraceae bacterium]|nr:hypothetical protein [Lachnospiraceae bacterium]